MRRPVGNDLTLGQLEGSDRFLGISSEARKTHLYVCGSTGTGKSKFLEHLIIQDIKRWSRSRCGMLVLDPHGSLYDSVMKWVTWYRDEVKRPIVPIDLRQSDWIVSYNPLRRRPDADPAVIVTNFVQAIAHVWGQANTANTPLFARYASDVLWALYDKEMTLVEAQHLVSRASGEIRAVMTRDLTHPMVAQAWAFANSLSPRDFDAQISSTVNRFRNFTLNRLLQLIFGQTGPSLDLLQALERGQIVLVNLSTQKGKICDEDAALFGTLLLSDLWHAATVRGKDADATSLKPFYVYVDEFQNFVTPTIAKNLDQARGFGLHLTLANQFPRQILHAGAHGEQVYDSVMANARSKVVFETQGEENLRALALSLFMGVMNPDEIKHQLHATRLVDYEEQLKTITSRSAGRSKGGGKFSGLTDTESAAGYIRDEEELDPHGYNKAMAQSAGDSTTWTESESESASSSTVLTPVLGQELSHVQFRSLDEQLFRAMAVLSDQRQRHGVARIVNMQAPACIVTPTIKPKPATANAVKRMHARLCKKLSFALPRELAERNISNREAELLKLARKHTDAEPKTAKRRIRH